MKEIILAIVIVVACLVAGFLGIRWVEIQCNNVPIVAEVNNEVVFKGPSYLCSVESTGDTTKLTIFYGFMGMFPKAYYVSDNIKVEGVK